MFYCVWKRYCKRKITLYYLIYNRKLLDQFRELKSIGWVEALLDYLKRSLSFYIFTSTSSHGSIFSRICFDFINFYPSLQINMFLEKRVECWVPNNGGHNITAAHQHPPHRHQVYPETPLRRSGANKKGCLLLSCQSLVKRWFFCWHFRRQVVLHIAINLLINKQETFSACFFIYLNKQNKLLFQINFELIEWIKMDTVVFEM